MKTGVEGARIVVVDDDAMVAFELSQALTPEGYEVETYGTAEDAMAAVTERRADLVILDLELPGASGLELLERVKAAQPETQVLILTGHGSFDLAVAATKKGAFAFLGKPVDREQLKVELRNALRSRRLESEVTTLKAQLSARSAVPTLTGASRAVQEVQALIRKVAPYDLSVLIIGESGTGKEVVARGIHAASARAAGPFVSVDCGALPDHLVESELFGYEKGAFTGAAVAKPGRFHLASGGTLFLDEIGNLPTPMQVKLLRVLQERSFVRLGGKAEEKVDLRLIAATNAALDASIRQGRFREDLYHRLNQFKILVPPLRERKGDLPVLVAHFAQEFSRELSRRTVGFADDALAILRDYNFPGNIRELQNIVRHAMVMSEGEVRASDLPEEIVRAARSGGGAVPRAAVAGGPGPADGDPLDLRSTVDRAEKDTIERALSESGWHQEKAARLLGITAKTLSGKMRQHNLRRPRPS